MTKKKESSQEGVCYQARTTVENWSLLLVGNFESPRRTRTSKVPPQRGEGPRVFIHHLLSVTRWELLECEAAWTPWYGRVAMLKPRADPSTSSLRMPTGKVRVLALAIKPPCADGGGSQDMDLAPSVCYILPPRHMHPNTTPGPGTTATPLHQYFQRLDDNSSSPNWV